MAHALIYFFIGTDISFEIFYTYASVYVLVVL